jgi:DNA-binding transcriptional regulator LsrR (DeoR family)
LRDSRRSRLDPAEVRTEVLTDRRRDLAARAAWLYHAKSKRQDEIALALGLSRQVVQRLISLAASENLIRFQLVHPLVEAIELADRLTDRFGLEYCEVALSTGCSADDIASIATAAAFYLEGLLQQTNPIIIGIGGQRVVRDAVLRVAPMQRPMHRLVSLMGNLTRHGRAGHYDAIMSLAERVGAQCFPLPMPVVANSKEEKAVLQAQTAFHACLELVEYASVLMMGIGYMNEAAPLHRDGFITGEELDAALRAGAVGELLGNCFDATGRFVDAEYADRLTSFSMPSPARSKTLIVQCGEKRVAAMRAALVGRLANGLITDEQTARRLLGD